MAELLQGLRAALADRYAVERPLGAGGMATVYLATDLKQGRKVALKVLRPELAAALGAERFLHEIRITATLQHPSILPLFDSGEADGLLFYVMPWVEGESLQARLAREKQLPLDEALRITSEIARALEYAHTQGVIHRDVKPANILLSGGQAILADFGIARAVTEAGGEKLTATGLALGTPAYMSPEQAAGGDGVDRRSDIYSLGCVLYEMLAGDPPFTGSSAQAILARKAVEPAPRLQTVRDTVPEALDRVILRALARVPADRFATATQFEKALTHAAAGGGVGAGDVAAGLRWRWWVPAGALAAILAIGAVLNVGGVRGRLLGRTPAPAEAIKLAVLPFENRTGDPTQEYFSDGLTEEMITQLGRLHPGRLGVIARTSAMRYKHTDKPIDQIGRELGVQYLLEGSARRESGRVRITTQLIRVSDQTQLWAESYERELTGIMSLQSDVARGIAKSLALALLPGEEARLGEARPVNPEAYEAYLKGRQHAHKLTAADLETALQYFELALQKDSHYALAYSGISLVWIARQQMQYVPPREAVPKAKAAAERALALDSTLADAHFRSATIKTWSDWDWPGAEREFQKGIDLDPNNAEARALYSHFLYIMKRPGEALIQINRALELDPLSELAHAFYGTMLIGFGRYDEAIAQATRVLRTAPKHPMALNQLSLAYHQRRMYPEALAAERSVRAARDDREMLAAIDRGYAEADYRGAMRRAAQTLAARFRATSTSPIGVATLYLRAGDHDQAIAWLEKAYEARDPNMPYIGVGKKYDPLRGDPRFQDLLRRMKLPS